MRADLCDGRKAGNFPGTLSHPERNFLPAGIGSTGSRRPDLEELMNARAKPTSRLSILVVEDDPAMREVLTARLESWGHVVLAAGDGEEARARLGSGVVDVVVSDVILPDCSGLDVLRLSRAGDRSRPVILVTAHADVDLAVEAMKEGAADFLTKPIETQKLKALLEAAGEEIRERSRTREIDEQLSSTAGLGRLVGRSPSMLKVFEMIELLAANEAAAILTGESGTGKELVARSVHDLGGRCGRPFVAVNCAAIPEGLMESELFGHVRGAFTGATRDRAGCFEQADGGTLLLDEIVEMPIALQPKLLRILDDGRVRRVGGSNETQVDVRVLAATNRPLEEALRDGALREDLFYRIAVFEVRLPPLRRRLEDIPLLTRHFTRAFNQKHGTSVEGLRDTAEELLLSYPWPGNVRELRNVVERSVIVARRGLIEPPHLPPYVRRGPGAEPEPDDRVVIPIGTAARDAERKLILSTLEAVGHNKAEAARRLEIDVKTIRNKLRRWEEESPEP
jgi:DNA-binding NtrC family response regulator